MKKSEIPADVMSSIRKSAKEEWADDAEMVEHYIDTEVDAYKALHKIEFGTAAAVKREILEGAAEVEDRWEDRLSIVESEVEAYQELQADFNDVPDALEPDSSGLNREGFPNRLRSDSSFLLGGGQQGWQLRFRWISVVGFWPQSPTGCRIAPRASVLP